jgi:hypothetical protein
MLRDQWGHELVGGVLFLACAFRGTSSRKE